MTNWNSNTIYYLNTSFEFCNASPFCGLWKCNHKVGKMDIDRSILMFVTWWWSQKIQQQKITLRVVGDKCKPIEYPTLPYCYKTNKLFSTRFRVNHIISNLQPLEELCQTVIRLQYSGAMIHKTCFCKLRRARFYFAKGKPSFIYTLFNSHIFSNSNKLYLFDITDSSLDIKDCFANTTRNHFPLDQLPAVKRPKNTFL